MGVADFDAARTRDAAERYGCVAHADHRALLGKVDVVSVAVPASFHHRVARDFIDAGVHVLIEKPIATESADARDLIAAAERSGAIIQVGHLERFSPAVAALREQLTDPRRITITRRGPWTGRSTDVDVVLDLMIHDIDLALVLAGAPVASVSASGIVAESGRVDEAEAWLTFTNGTIATLSASRVAEQGERKLTVTEAETLFAADLSGPTLTVTRRRERGAAPVQVALQPQDALQAEIAAFLASAAAGARPDVDGAAGLAALEIAERIQASIAEAETPTRRSM